MWVWVTYLLLGRDVGMFICGCGLRTSSWAGMWVCLDVGVGYVPPPGPGCRYVYMWVWVTYLLLGRDVGMFIFGCGLRTSSWAGM